MALKTDTALTVPLGLRRALRMCISNIPNCTGLKHFCSVASLPPPHTHILTSSLLPQCCAWERRSTSAFPHSMLSASFSLCCLMEDYSWVHFFFLSSIIYCLEWATSAAPCYPYDFSVFHFSTYTFDRVMTTDFSIIFLTSRMPWDSLICIVPFARMEGTLRLWWYTTSTPPWWKETRWWRCGETKSLLYFQGQCNME